MARCQKGRTIDVQVFFFAPYLNLAFSSNLFNFFSSCSFFFCSNSYFTEVSDKRDDSSFLIVFLTAFLFATRSGGRIEEVDAVGSINWDNIDRCLEVLLCRRGIWRRVHRLGDHKLRLKMLVCRKIIRSKWYISSRRWLSKGSESSHFVVSLTKYFSNMSDRNTIV